MNKNHAFGQVSFFFTTCKNNLEVRKNCISSHCSHSHGLLWQRAGGVSSSMNGTQVNFMLELSQLAPTAGEGLL